MTFDPIQLRHQLHQIPEIAFDEHETKELLLQHLRKLLAQTLSEPETPFQIEEFRNSLGILVAYNGGGSGDYTLFRADMDALPSEEANICEYTSQKPGFMHACGHDVHMAVLMGLIHVVSQRLPLMNILFLFQPAEEGKGGAESVLAEGLIQNFPIRAAIALHVASELPVGTASTKRGIFFGIPQEFDIRFFGRAAHVAFPEKGINANAAGYRFLNALEKEISLIENTERVICNVGRIQGGSIRNIIADECILEGTHRSLKRDVRDSLNSIITKLAEHTAKEIGAKCKVDFLCSYDPVINDSTLVDALEEVAQSQNVEFFPAQTAMTGEDFGFFSTLYPGLLFWLGSGAEHPLHSNKFLPQDECIQVGIDLFWGLIKHLK